MIYTVEWESEADREQRYVCDAKVQLINNNKVIVLVNDVDDREYV